MAIGEGNTAASVDDEAGGVVVYLAAADSVSKERAAVVRRMTTAGTMLLSYLRQSLAVATFPETLNGRTNQNPQKRRRKLRSSQSFFHV